MKGGQTPVGIYLSLLPTSGSHHLNMEKGRCDFIGLFTTRQEILFEQMVQQSTLLQIIQFVGLITPALAIIIELIVRFHGGLDTIKENKRVPIEIHSLFFGFIGILVGGMVIGIQFGFTLNNQLTRIATLFIFGGLPFLALTVLIMSIRISGISDSSSSLLENFAKNIKYGLSIAIPAVLCSILYFGIVYYLHESINMTVS